MKRILGAVFATATIWFLSGAGHAVPLGSVRLEVTGISPVSGTLMLAIHRSRESLEGDAEPLRRVRVRVTAERMFVGFDDLVSGYYAIAVYQDVNANGRLDRTGSGVPIEPVGFSSNAMGRRGLPEFRDAAILVDGPDIPHAITLVMPAERR